MAQKITIFKEPNQLIINIGNPTPATVKAVESMFGNTIIDLANLLKPVDNSAKDNIEREAVEEKMASAAEFVNVKETDECPFDEGKKEKREESQTNPTKKVVDVEEMSIAESKEWLKRFLMALKKRPSMQFNAHRIFAAYAIAQNKRHLLDGLDTQSEDLLHEIFEKKNLALSIGKLVEFPMEEDDGWV